MGNDTNISKENSAFSGLIGVGREDITPPVGIYNRNWGAARMDKANGIHRPLSLTCLTFQQHEEKEPLILISADLGFWYTKEDEWRVRQGILNEFCLDESRLMFCLTHTHAGPNLFRENSEKPGGEFIEPYLSKVRDVAIRTVTKALAKPLIATLTWHYGKSNLAANRDLPNPGNDKMRPFLVGFNPAKPADETLLVGRITENTSDTIIATIVNYACHPTTLGWGNQLISSDYVGAMREIVEKETNGAPCVFLQGASGELAPAEQYMENVQVADRNGFQLGYAALSTLASMLPPSTKLIFDNIKESGAPLGVWKREKYYPKTSLHAEVLKVSLPLKKLPSLVELDEKLSLCEDRALKERLWRLRGIRKSIGSEINVLPVPVWIWELGNSFLIGQPNEPYSFFQQQIRKSTDQKVAAVMNLVNGSYGYLPPTECYNKDIYQVWQTPYDMNSLELLIGAIQGYLKRNKDN